MDRFTSEQFSGTKPIGTNYLKNCQAILSRRSIAIKPEPFNTEPWPALVWTVVTRNLPILKEKIQSQIYSVNHSNFEAKSIEKNYIKPVKPFSRSFSFSSF